MGSGTTSCSHARGAIVSIYTDGVLTSAKPQLTTGTIDTDDLGYGVNIGQDGLGTYTDGGSAGITNALMDDVGIWRRALSPQEASAIYTAGQNGKDLSQAVTAVPGVKLTVVGISGGNINLAWQGSPTPQAARDYQPESALLERRERHAGRQHSLRAYHRHCAVLQAGTITIPTGTRARLQADRVRWA